MNENGRPVASHYVYLLNRTKYISCFNYNIIGISFFNVNIFSMLEHTREVKSYQASVYIKIFFILFENEENVTYNYHKWKGGRQLMRKKLLSLFVATSMIFSTLTVSAQEIVINEVVSEELNITEDSVIEENQSIIEENIISDELDVEVETTDTEIVLDVVSAEGSNITSEYVVAPGYEGIVTPEDLKKIVEERGDSFDELVGATTCTTYNQAVSYVRSQLKNRVVTISFTTTYTNAEQWKRILEDAEIDNASTPYDEGDYIKSNIIGYSSSYNWSGSAITYNISMIYTDTAEYNQTVLNTLPTVMSALALDGKSEYDKVKEIHDFICENAVYSDRYMVYDNNGNYIFHSAYSALILGETVCQGYSSLFHIMCKRAGVQSRYITGWGNGGAHAWNIVKIGDYWYNIDLTWDDNEYGGVDYEYFLKSEEDFGAHIRENPYDAASFYAEYPMAPFSYGDAEIQGLDITNPINHSFTTITGETVTTRANGKPKLLVYYGNTCSNSQSLIKTIAASSWINQGKIDVIAFETYGGSNSQSAEKALVQSFKNTYAPNCNAIKFTYTGVNQAIWDFYDYKEMTGIGGNTMPYVVLLDANNQIQAMTSGFITASQLENKYFSLVGLAPSRPLTKFVVCRASNGGPLKVGETETLKYTYEPLNTTEKVVVSWRSSNPTVVSVDNYGKITANNAGTASIIGSVSVSKGTFTSKVDITVTGRDVNVVFNPNGGIVSTTSKTVTVGDTYGTLPIPSRGGYIFDGWYTQLTGGDKITHTSIVSNNSDHILYAHWSSSNNNVNSTNVTERFIDVSPSMWFVNAVQYALDNGIMSGTGKNTFSPNNSCTRGMMVTILYSSIGQPPVNGQVPFRDLTASWYKNAVVWAYQNGITSGKSATEFAPDVSVTRQEMAVFLYTFASNRGFDLSAEGNIYKFSDVSSIDGWAVKAVKWANGNSIINGKGANLDPKGRATRAEVAQMVMGFQNRFGK